MMRRLAAAFSLLRGVPRQAGLGLLLLTLLLGPAPGRAAGGGGGGRGGEARVR